MIYKMTVAGAEPVFMRDSSKAKGLERLVTVESLTSEQFADAIEAGAKLWKAGDKIKAEGAPAAPEAKEAIGTINLATGMMEGPEPGVSRPASLAELAKADPESKFRIEHATEKLQRQPAGKGKWEDVRGATPEEITASQADQ